MNYGVEFTGLAEEDLAELDHRDEARIRRTIAEMAASRTDVAVSGILSFAGGSPPGSVRQ